MVPGPHVVPKPIHPAKPPPYSSEAELTLLRALRELQLEPHEAVAELLQARSTAMRSSSPSMRVESPPPS